VVVHFGHVHRALLFSVMSKPNTCVARVRLKRDGTCAENRFSLSPKRTSPFKSAGASVQSTAGSRGVRISIGNAEYTTFRGSVRVMATHSIHFLTRGSPCTIRFQTHSTNNWPRHQCLQYMDSHWSTCSTCVRSEHLGVSINTALKGYSY